jgi:hypothetical protein
MTKLRSLSAREVFSDLNHDLAAASKGIRFWPRRPRRVEAMTRSQGAQRAAGDDQNGHST